MMNIDQISMLLTEDPDVNRTPCLLERGSRKSALRSAQTRKRNRELAAKSKSELDQKIEALGRVVNLDAVMQIFKNAGLTGITIEELAKKVTPDEKGKQALAKYMTAKGLFRNVVEYLDSNGHISSRTYWSKRMLERMLQDPQQKEWLVEKLSNQINLGRLAEKSLPQTDKIKYAALAIGSQNNLGG